VPKPHKEPEKVIGKGKGRKDEKGKGKGRAREGGEEEEEEEEREWPVEAAEWSSRTTTADVRTALTLADHWETTAVEGGQSPMVVEGGAVVAGDPWWESVVKGLAREAGVVDFDDGALHLLLQEWDKCLRAAAGGPPGTRSPP
jgi:hypothetical protein